MTGHSDLDAKITRLRQDLEELKSKVRKCDQNLLDFKEKILNAQRGQGDFRNQIVQRKQENWQIRKELESRLQGLRAMRDRIITKNAKKTDEYYEVREKIIDVQRKLDQLDMGE